MSGCTPGSTGACLGPGQCEGVQLCNDEGSGFGACECGGDATGGAGAAGDGAGAAGDGAGAAGDGAGAAGDGAGAAGDGAAGDGGAAGEGALGELTRQVGAPCVVDADCGGPLTCATADGEGVFGEGGPAGGYCTMSCTEREQCSSLDPLSACTLFDAAGNGFCIALCEPGVTSATTGLATIKCVGLEGVRAEQSCLPTNDGSAGVCIPRCSSDEACPDGRFCDPGPSGLCVDEAPSGGGVGAACTDLTREEDCQSGDCFVVAGGGSFCSAFCTFGAVAGCGFSAAASSLGAACLDTAQAGGAEGDLGQCFELCDEDADCVQSELVCVPLEAGSQAILGRTGFCAP